MNEPWYKNAVFYSLDVETYYDSNGDGIGDFQGLIRKLDGIAGLGANCIWLLPFYPSPNRDNGYDVMDYYNVDARLGTLGDFSEMLEKAEQAGLRVIIDLVINHTSNRHPWFREARKDPQSPFRDFYVWSDEPQAYEQEHLMLQGEENTMWTYDEEAGQYYLHRFYKEQPDLNITNPKVREEILKIMGFWLRLGVHGFRIDAAQMLVEPYGLKGADKNELLRFMNEIREFTGSRKKDALLLAEVNAGPEEMMMFVEEGERMHMLFNFFLNQHLFLALAKGNPGPLEKALHLLPALPSGSQWLQFLRHHDELNLRLLPGEEKEIVLQAFAPLKEMRVYKTGIRRRLAPMLNHHSGKLELAYSLLFSMPGAQLVRYGDEIGMGDDLSLQGRNSVRTPMQWAPLVNGGFSSAPENELVHPVISGGEFGYEKINVLTAQQQKDSLLNWLERLITTRRQCPEIGLGQLCKVRSIEGRVLIHGYEWENRKLFFAHNLSGEPCKISIKELQHGNGKLFSVFGGADLKNGDEAVLEGYAYRWFRSENNE